MEPELQQQMAPEQMGAGNMPTQQESDNVLVHMSREEEEELSRAQGGRDIDPELQVPSFDKLWGMISSNPEMQQQISMMFSQMKGKSKYETDKIEDKVDQIQDDSMGQRPEPFISPNPEMQELAALGKNGDDTIITMPKDFLFFLWDNSPNQEKNETNPNTGLPQFGFWSGLLSILGGVAGTFVPGLGNILGAGLGSALGNFGGSYIDESDLPEEEKSSFLSKLGGSALAGGLGALGGYLTGGGAAAGATGAGADAAGKTSNQMIQQLGSLAGKNASPEVVNSLIKGTASKVAGGGLSFLDKLKNIDPFTWAKLGMEGLSSFGAVNSDKKNAKLNQKEAIRFWQDQEKIKRENREWEQKQAEEAYRRNVEMYNLMRQRIGGDLSIMAPKDSNIIDPTKINELNDPGLRRFKDGGVVDNDDIIHLKEIKRSMYIKGDHKGQKDNIYVDVPEGSYVIDAMTVAAIGDGNSHAGEKIIKSYVDSIKKHSYKVTKMIPCALSSGEFVITPETILGIGSGDLKKGHKILEHFIKEIRAHKGMKESKIPPASKDLQVYIRSAVKKRMRSA